MLGCTIISCATAKYWKWQVSLLLLLLFCVAVFQRLRRSTFLLGSQVSKWIVILSVVRVTLRIGALTFDMIPPTCNNFELLAFIGARIFSK